MALRRGSGIPQCNIVTRMPLATIALLCKQTTDNFRTRPPPALPMAPSIGLSDIICSLLHLGETLVIKETLVEKRSYRNTLNWTGRTGRRNGRLKTAFMETYTYISPWSHLYIKSQSLRVFCVKPRLHLAEYFSDCFR